MRSKVLFAAIVLLVAAVCYAALPIGEKTLTSDDMIITRGATHIVIRADGSAFIRVYSRGVRYPYHASSDSVYTVDDTSPAPFSAVSGIDSVKVVLDEATAVTVTWGSW